MKNIAKIVLILGVLIACNSNSKGEKTGQSTKNGNTQQAIPRSVFCHDLSLILKCPAKAKGNSIQ